MLSMASLFTGVAVYFALVGAIDNAVDKRLQSERRELLHGDPDAATLARRIHSEARLRDSGDIGYLLTRGGRPLAQNIQPMHSLPIGYSTVGSDIGIPGLTRGRALVEDRSDGTRLTMVIESEPIDRHDAHRMLILVAGFGTVLVLVVVGVLALGLTVRTRIDALRRTAEAIVEGDLGARVPVVGRDGSFGRQAEAFNRMLDRIEGLMESLRGVSNDVAHDLRTPLARLRARLGAIAAQPQAAPIQDAMADAVEECDEILAMFGAILRIVEVEGGHARAGFRAIDLATVAEDAALSLDAMVEESGHVLRPGPWQRATIQADRHLIVQAIVNLIENAVHHTPPGTTIRVAVERQGEQAVLTVADDGPGIAVADRPVALRRFGRLDASRNGGGHGLGLPLIAAIVRLHRGELMLDAPGGEQSGLLVSVRLPLMQEEENAAAASPFTVDASDQKLSEASRP
jgi:signal transduction histidine kinase